MWESPLIKKLIDLAILEDISFGDVTTELCVDDELSGSAKIFAKEDFVVCGLPIISLIADRAGCDIPVELTALEGDFIKKGSTLAIMKGRLSHLLSLERTILNFIQRLCGCATLTREVVAKAQGILIADTRKTTPGWRILEKYAVRVGGGKNHRFSLSDMILVKDNHIDANGGSVKKTLEKVVSKRGIYTPFEVEVRSITELKEAIPFQPSSIMLDNMDESQIEQSIALIKKDSPASLIEVSGGVQPELFSKLSKLEVSLVSMGFLTSQYRAVDISMDIEI